MSASLSRILACVCCSFLFIASAQAQHSRRTPITEAVQKTKAAVVTIKAYKDRVESNQNTTGTGVIVDELGYIVTSLHVVAGADHVVVHTSDAIELNARVVVDDKHNDLAILAVNAGKKLPYLQLGPGSDLMVGETVIAVGHPYGYQNTVSTGIISAIGREIPLGNGVTLTNLIQTTASINPGNSGGPILNINGELIGITAAMRDNAQGIAFALNSDTVKDVLCKYLNARKVAGLNHGVSCQEQVAEEGKDRQRVIVRELTELAAEDGLQRGDTILKVAERCVANTFDLERALWQKKAGEKVTFTVLRAGKEVSVAVRLTGATELATSTPNR